MIEKYRSEVLRYYEEKKETGALTINLLHPTCVNLRNELRSLLTLGCNSTDQRIIKDFLEMPHNKGLSELSFRRLDPDKFKPLCNFLKKCIKTHEKNVELLAILIDFQPRPFSNYWRISEGKAKHLSEFTITQSGILEENNLNDACGPERCRLEIISAENMNPDYFFEQDQGESIMLKQKVQKKVTLEYPSGVKLHVDAADIPLIAQLVKL